MSSVQRMSVREAAEVLGITVEGVRQRIRRGQLESEKDDDGRVYVWVTVNQAMSEPDSTKAILDAKDEVIATKDETIQSLNEIIETLTQELAKWQEEASRKDHLLASLMQRIPAIEPPTEEPPDTQESPVTASEEERKGETPQEAEKADQQPWWRRLFSG